LIEKIVVKKGATRMMCRSICKIASLLLGVMIISGTVWAEDGLFPHYKILEPNVSFWEQVYTQYTTTQAIVHDNSDLSIIYDVIDLLPQDAPGARAINRKRMKRAKKRYQGILKRLASNPRLANDSCRRVAGLFGPAATAKTFYRARHRIRCQIGQSDRFIQGIRRSGAFIDQIRGIFKSYGIPEDLAYLPHVESSFNPKAYSKFGAAGIWQFTRSTGKRFMTVGYALDERRDPILASHAAAKLLKENFSELGSWPLAITAYNHGRTGMKRAKLKMGGYPAIFRSYTSRTFKFASRNFYAEFLAARRIATNYRDYFGNIQLDRPTPYRRITLAGYLPFDALCEHFSISPETLQRINPALREPVIRGQKHIPRDYTLRLPAEETPPAHTVALIPETLYKQHQKPSRFYTVQRGDTAGTIARRHGVRLTDLILANNLSRRATIYPHQTLRIPLKGEALHAEPAKPVDKSAATPALADAAPETPDETASQPSAPSPYPAPVLASVIPSPGVASEAPPSRSLPEERQPEPGEQAMAAEVSIEKLWHENGQAIGVIRVEVEETLGHFAEWAGVRTWQIRRLNDLAYGQTLHLHQKLKIPLGRRSSHTFEENRYEHHKRLQEDFFSVYRISSLVPYRIQRGDNYWTLCQAKFDIPMWLLSNCNPEVDFAKLRIHQEVLIPVVEKLTKADEDDPRIPFNDDVSDLIL
jgi:membrane-bound lytic murein transglycosylase D